MTNVNSQIVSIIRSLEELEATLDFNIGKKIARGALYSVRALDAYLNKDKYAFKKAAYDAIEVIDRVEMDILKQSEEDEKQYLS